MDDILNRGRVQTKQVDEQPNQLTVGFFQISYLWNLCILGLTSLVNVDQFGIIILIVSLQIIAAYIHWQQHVHHSITNSLFFCLKKSLCGKTGL